MYSQLSLCAWLHWPMLPHANLPPWQEASAPISLCNKLFTFLVFSSGIWRQWFISIFDGIWAMGWWERWPHNLSLCAGTRITRAQRTQWGSATSQGIPIRLARNQDHFGMFVPKWQESLTSLISLRRENVTPKHEVAVGRLWMRDRGTIGEVSLNHRLRWLFSPNPLPMAGPCMTSGGPENGPDAWVSVLPPVPICTWNLPQGAWPVINEAIAYPFFPAVCDCIF